MQQQAIHSRDSDGNAERLVPEIAHRARASSRSCYLAGLLSAMVGFVAFLPALQNDFVYDDVAIILHNRTVTAPGAWYRFWRVPWWPRGVSRDRLYRPLTLWSYRANFLLQKGCETLLLRTTLARNSPNGAGAPEDPSRSGTDGSASWTDEIARSGPLDEPRPFWFHLVNLVLHGLTCTGVALLAYRLSGRAAAAWIAGLLFAAHPIHTEAVVTGYGRAELLAGFLSVWLLVVYVAPRQNRRRTAYFYWGTALLFLAALMCKEHVLFVWPLLLLLDCQPQPQEVRQPRRTCREWLNGVIGVPHAGFMLATAIFFALRTSVFLWRVRLPGSEVRHWEAPLGHATFIEHLLTPLRLLWLTVELCAWPPWLCPIWSKPSLQLASQLSPDVIAGLCLLVLLIALGSVLWFRGHALGAIILGILILMALPTQAISLANWFFAERWLYLPTVLLAVTVGAVLSRGVPLIWAISVATALVLLPASWNYTAVYRNNLTFSTDVVRRQPDNVQGLLCLSASNLIQEDYTAALQNAGHLLEITDDIPEAHLTLATAYLAMKDGEKALREIARFEQMAIPAPGMDLGTPKSEAQALIEEKRRRSIEPASAPSPTIKGLAPTRSQPALEQITQPH